MQTWWSYWWQYCCSMWNKKGFRQHLCVFSDCSVACHSLIHTYKECPKLTNRQTWADSDWPQFKLQYKIVLSVTVTVPAGHFFLRSIMKMKILVLVTPALEAAAGWHGWAEQSHDWKLQSLRIVASPSNACSFVSKLWLRSNWLTEQCHRQNGAH